MNIIYYDLRDNYKYRLHHKPGAINLSYNRLMRDYKILLDKKSIYYFHCESGIKSRKAQAYLSALGYNVKIY